MDPRAPAIRAISRAFALLEVLAREGSSISLSGIACRLGLPASSTHRLLAALVALGYVKQEAETGHYALDLKLASLGGSALRQLDFREAARPVLKEIAARCAESTNLVVLHQGEVVYVDRAEGTGLVRAFARIGTRAPAHATAAGKVLLADLALPELLALTAERPLKPLTPRTVTDPRRLIEELNAVRLSGYAIDDEECEIGARCVAAAVRNYSGRAVAAISISGPASRLDARQTSRLIALLREKALNLSQKLGLGAQAETLYPLQPYRSPGHRAPRSDSDGRKLRSAAR